jgi:hypothetical protein
VVSTTDVVAEIRWIRTGDLTTIVAVLRIAATTTTMTIFDETMEAEEDSMAGTAWAAVEIIIMVRDEQETHLINRYSNALVSLQIGEAIAVIMATLMITITLDAMMETKAVAVVGSWEVDGIIIIMVGDIVSQLATAFFC